MADLVVAAARLIAGSGVLLATAVYLATGRLTVALPVLLDMLMAAGVLRLGAEAPWSSVATAAAIIVLRKVVLTGIHQASATDRGVPFVISPPGR
jgi:hypothetical protein